MIKITYNLRNGGSGSTHTSSLKTVEDYLNGSKRAVKEVYAEDADGNMIGRREKHPDGRLWIWYLCQDSTKNNIKAAGIEEMLDAISRSSIHRDTLYKIECHIAKLRESKDEVIDND